MNSPQPKSERKVVIRWEHHRPTLCTCCDKPAEFKIYVPDRNSRIGARLVLLCSNCFHSLEHKVVTDREIIIPELVRIKEKTDTPSYKGYKSALGVVIRDTDPGALSDEEWQDKLHPNRRSGSKSKNGSPQQVLTQDAIDEIGSGLLDMLSVE